MRILTDSSLPNIEQAFPGDFIIQQYQDNAEVAGFLRDQDILLCRSTLKVDQDLLKNAALKYILTASSGTDHIDKNSLQAQHIQLIDAKGSNAISVADYVLATLASLAEEGINIGKKAGIIGLGAVGSEVLLCLKLLGYEVIAYDPPREKRDTTFESCPLEALYSCDLLCIHAELQTHFPVPSQNLLNAAFFNNLQPNTLIINASRGGIVNEFDLLNTAKKPIYCTDVYLNEPHINPAIVNYAKICTPHIAGHSLEAKTAAVHAVSRKLHVQLHLAIPESVKFSRPSLRKIDYNSWREQILSWYDPRQETHVLKKYFADKEVFLALRKKHNFRHDFHVYETK